VDSLFLKTSATKAQDSRDFLQLQPPLCRSSVFTLPSQLLQVPRLAVAREVWRPTRGSSGKGGYAMGYLQPHSPRREHLGKTRNTKSKQVAGLFSALQISTEMAAGFPFFNHPCLPDAPTPSPRSLPWPPAACSWWRFSWYPAPSHRGWISVGLLQRCVGSESRSPRYRCRARTQTHNPPSMPQRGSTKQPLRCAFSQNLISKVWNAAGKKKKRHGRNVLCSTRSSV